MQIFVSYFKEQETRLEKTVLLATLHGVTDTSLYGQKAQYQKSGLIMIEELLQTGCIKHGNFKLNPIHGEDLATFCVDAMDNGIQEVSIGGIDIFFYSFSFNFS